MIVGHEERLPGEDRWLDADFEELYRLGSLTDAEWELPDGIHEDSERFRPVRRSSKRTSLGSRRWW